MNNSTINAFDNSYSKLALDVGPTWSYFEGSITPENARRFNNAYNLVSGWNFTAPDETDNDEETLMPDEDETTLALELQHILIDETLTFTEQTQQIRALLMNNIIDCLAKIGLTIETDQIDINHFDLILDVLDLIYVLNQFEDLQSISTVLESVDIPPLDRFLETLRIVKGYDVSQLEPLYYIITDASEYLLETLRLALIVPDFEIDTPEYVKERILKNKSYLLDNTLAGDHIKASGTLGMGITTLRQFYLKELTQFREALPAEYINQIIYFTLISDLKDEAIPVYVADFLKKECDDLAYYYQAEALLGQLGIKVVAI